MRTIDIEDAGVVLKEMLLNPDPVDEDIVINTGNGKVLGVIISEQAYAFFLKKVESEEDRSDAATIEEFHRTKV